MSAINKRIEKAIINNNGIRIDNPVSAIGGFYYAKRRINMVGRYLF